MPSVEISQNLNTFTFDVTNATDTPFVLNTTACILGFSLLSDEIDYTDAAKTVEQNFYIDRIVTTVSDDVPTANGNYIENVNVEFISSSVVRVTGNFQFSAGDVTYLSALSGKRYCMTFDVVDDSLTIDNADRVTLLVDANDLYIDTSNDGLIVFDTTIVTMAYAGAVPWHGLGERLLPTDTLEEAQVKGGLNWTVSMRPVQYVKTHLPNITTTFKDRFVLARDTDDYPMAVVSNRYKPVQPKTVIKFIANLIDRFGMKLHTLGSLRNGQRIWALAQTGDAYKVMGVDQIDSYLMCATSYDLSFSTIAQFTSVCVVCNNTLQQSFKNHSGRVTIPHMAEFDIDKVHDELGVGREQWHAFTQMCESLAAIKLDANKAHEVLTKVWQIDPDKPTHDQVHVGNVISLFQGRGIGADIRGQTGWGLVNAMTQYVDQNKRARNQGNRLDSAWFGDGFNLKQRAVDETLLLAA